jgi:hypothetical protein
MRTRVGRKAPAYFEEFVSFTKSGRGFPNGKSLNRLPVFFLRLGIFMPFMTILDMSIALARVALANIADAAKKKSLLFMTVSGLLPVSRTLS